MSRSIDWYVLTQQQAAFRPDQVMELGRRVVAAGFEFVNPHLKQIMLLGGGEEGQIAVRDETSLFGYLSTHATALVSIWKGDLEISLEFDPTGSTLAEQASTAGIDDDSMFGAVVIHLDRTYLRDQEKAAMVVGDVNRLFVSLCDCLNVPFGFAVDEWSIEGLTAEWHVQREVAVHTIPSIHFPVGYYSKTQFPDIPVSRFVDLGFACESIGSSGHVVAKLEELLG